MPLPCIVPFDALPYIGEYMTIIRYENHAENVSDLIIGLENGSRLLSALEAAHIIRTLWEALEASLYTTRN